MDTSFLLPVMDELFAAFARGVMRGVTHELANPTAPVMPQAAASVSAPVVVAARRSRPARPAPAGLSAAPSVGALVRYRQGRGTFDATVVSVDAARNVATIRRTTDGREVIRPFSKLFEAAGAAPAIAVAPAVVEAATAAVEPASDTPAS